MEKSKRNKTLSFCVSEAVEQKIRDGALQNGIRVSSYLDQLVSATLNERSVHGDADALRSISERLIGIENRLADRDIGLRQQYASLNQELLRKQDIPGLLEGFEKRLKKSFGLAEVLPKEPSQPIDTHKTGELFK